MTRCRSVILKAGRPCRGRCLSVSYEISSFVHLLRDLHASQPIKYMFIIQAHSKLIGHIYLSAQLSAATAKPGIVFNVRVCLSLCVVLKTYNVDRHVSGCAYVCRCLYISRILSSDKAEWQLIPATLCRLRLHHHLQITHSIP